MKALLRHVLIQLFRNPWLYLYFGVLFFSTEIILQLAGGAEEKSVLSVLHLSLLLVPIGSSLFALIHWYGSESFLQSVLIQPISRTQIFFSRFLALVIATTICVGFGLAVPLIEIGSGLGNWFFLLFLSVTINLSFLALSLLFCVMFRDRLRGFGYMLGLLGYFLIIHDAAVFWGIILFNQYPITEAVLGSVFLNPLSIAQFLILARFEKESMMGGLQFFLSRSVGSQILYGADVLALQLWWILPIWLGIKKFKKVMF